jgi:hypothetical protein
MRYPRAVPFALLALAVLPAVAAGQLVPVREEFRVNPVEEGGQFGSDVAAHPGGFVVVFNENGLLFARRYDVTGTALDTQIAVGGATTGHVAADAAGNFVVVWEDGGIRARRFDASGSALGAEFFVSTTTPAVRPGVAADPSGGFLVVWQVNGVGSDVYGRRYDASGTALGPPFAITSDGISTLPSVACDGAGNGIVVWQVSGGLVGRRVDPTGTLLGGFQVTGITSSVGHYPAAVSAESSGAFVVAWQEGPSFSSGPIMARRYNAGGAPLVGPFGVRSTSDGLTYDVDVAADATTGFVATWTKEVDGSGDIMLRRFDTAGVAQGPEVEVSTRTAAGPAIASDGDGGIVVMWTGSPFAGSDVLARRYGFDAPLNGTSLSLRDDADPTRRKLVFRSVDRSLSTAPGAGIRPAVNGAVLRIHNAMGSGEVACLPLPASGWGASGNPERPSYRYSDRAGVNGPCRSAVVSHRGRLKAACRATDQPIPYSLDEPQQGSVGVDLMSGTARYCTLFGGTITNDSGAEQRFGAKRAPAPGTCPAAPACP